MKLENPWKRLPRKPPFVLPSDLPVIKSFNRDASSRFKIFDHLLPVPYLGLPEAPILLLNLNPGYSDEDEIRQTTARFKRAARKSLLHKPDAPSAGFYFLDYSIESSDSALGAGSRWWKRALGRLLTEFGNEIVARSFFCVEYFPYRSREFREIRVDSQFYGFELVRLAIRRGALIIIMRSRRRWLDKVPELSSYSRVFALRSPRNPALTLENCPHGFPQVIRILKRILKRT
jgi:hypothetical protein